MARRLVRSSTAVDDSDGSFMGFDSSSDSSDNSDVEKGDTHHSLDEKPLLNSTHSTTEAIPEENALDGFPNWLDRLFEGSTQRYHINYWPEFGNY